jgi:putative drug exporter of the RND superfamily
MVKTARATPASKRTPRCSGTPARSPLRAVRGQVLESLARFDIRFRWLVVALWIVAAIAATRLLPSLGAVTQSNNALFLPASAPSQQAAALATPFQNPNVGASAVIVAVRSGEPLTAADESAVSRIEQAAAAVPGVTQVRDLGTSSDGRASEALVVTTGDGLTNTGNPAVVDKIRQTFGTAGTPPGLTFHLTGPLAQATDAAAKAAQTGTNIRVFTVLFVIALLFIVYRSVLAPLVTLLPAVLSLLLSEPLIAKASEWGLQPSPATVTLLPVLLLGAGADYGLFLVFRLREEIRRGASPNDALVVAMGRVGQSISFSALTVIAALCCMLLASFGLYRQLGPSLALGVAVILLAGLTLLPALLAIFGRALFWPSHPKPGEPSAGVWGRVATRAVDQPIPIILVGLVLFGVLAVGLTAFRTGGFTTAPATGTDSGAGAAVLAAHFPAAGSNSETLVLRFATPIWEHPADVLLAEQEARADPALRAVSGPLDPNGTSLDPNQLSALHAQLGPAQALPQAPQAGSAIPVDLYRAYKATAQLISADGRTVQLFAVPAGGVPGSQAAIECIPALRTTTARAAAKSGASAGGVVGLDATAYDIEHASTSDLAAIVPLVLLAIAILLAALLRSLVAPIYLIVTVGLSFLAALGFASFVFIRLGGDDGLNFVIPILLFIFAMALGEDYNILLMTRVREEAHDHPVHEALVRAVGYTGGTITSAGVILAGTFAVLALAGNSDQSRQLGFTIAFAILVDTFFVRTLLVPSVAALLGRWNWWPSKLSVKLERL